MLISYAQNFEDVILWRALRHVERGCYVDVGAQDPVVDSVSLAFYEQGWRGLHVEPTAQYADKLRLARPDEEVIQAVVGERAGAIAFFEIADSGLSTANLAIAEEHERRGFILKRVDLPCIPLSQVLKRAPREDIHWLKIDVEGMECEVIESWSPSTVRPWIVVVESVRPLSPEPAWQAWEPRLLALGYEFVYFDGLNRFYLSCNHRELRHYFGAGPNVFDDFVFSEFANAPFCQSLTRQISVLRSQAKALETELIDPPNQVEQARQLAADLQERLQHAEAAIAQSEKRRMEAEDAAAEATKQLDLLRTHTDEELQQARSEMRLLDIRERQCARRLQQREVLLEAMYRSSSWRATAPLRALKATGRRAQSGLPRLHSQLLPRPAMPTLFIECTHTFHSNLNTGIQRVVRSVLRHAPTVASRHGYAVVPVILDRGRFIAADAEEVIANRRPPVLSGAPGDSGPVRVDFRSRISKVAHLAWRALLRALSKALPFDSAEQFLFAPPDRVGLAWCLRLPLRAVNLRPGRRPLSRPGEPISLDHFARCDDSILLLLDSSWTIPIWPAVERFKRAGGKVVGVIYDLIPVTHSHTSMPNLSFAFRSWLKEHFRQTDAFIGISRFVADEVARFSTEMVGYRDGKKPPLKIDYFHLGSDIEFVSDGDDARPDIRRIFEPGRHVFLMVGSFEPRKGHSYALDAFDRFWASGGTASLVMIGRQAWKTEAFLERVNDHPQRGRQLFVVRDATDSELEYGYRNASALVLSSEIEGFGLPIVEAFQRGLPVLCSDIPVFREIAENRATFFDLSDSLHLTQALLDFCRAHDAHQRSERAPHGWIDWRESTEQLCCAITRSLGPPSGTVTGAAA